jgi:hypothetical protein
MLKASIIRYIILEKEDGNFTVSEIEKRIEALEKEVERIRKVLMPFETTLHSKGMPYKKVSKLPGDREHDSNS